MDYLNINEIEEHENEIKELKRLVKVTKNVRMYKNIQ